MRSCWGPDFVSVWWFRLVLCVWRGEKKKILSLKCDSAFWPVHSCCVGGPLEPFKGFSLIIRVMPASCVWCLKICWRWKIFLFCNECFQMQNFIRPLWFIPTIQQLLHPITCTCKHHFQELDTWPLTFFVGAFFFSCAYRFFCCFVLNTNWWGQQAAGLQTWHIYRPKSKLKNMRYVFHQECGSAHIFLSESKESERVLTERSPYSTVNLFFVLCPNPNWDRHHFELNNSVVVTMDKACLLQLHAWNLGTVT